MTNRVMIRHLYTILGEQDVYLRTLGKLNFDMEVCAPEEGMALAGEDQAVIAKNIYRLNHSRTYIRLLNDLHGNHENLSEAECRAVEYRYLRMQKEKNLTAAVAYEKDLASGRAYGAWIAAKKAADFSLFRDSLAEMVRVTRRNSQLDDTNTGTLYDSCLDDHERGGNIAQLDDFFAKLRARIVPLLRRIMTEGKPIREDFLSRPCPIPEQEAFSRFLMQTEGLRPSATVLMTTEHPFTESFGKQDVRITTHYYEDNFFSNIFTTMHEGGHALFMQYLPDFAMENHLNNMMSHAMHECISRFFENIIGRSEAFIHFIYPKLKNVSEGLMDGISERELYEAANRVCPNLIRCDADELTYCLHIMVRYEIERGLINGDITVDDVPAVWNAKYAEYLGLDVPDDAQGCLQDVHWTSEFGYFPSYALGSAYGAQILHTMEKEIDVWGQVARGDLSGVLNWLIENVFGRAVMLDPDDWIRAVTGEGLNPDYYLDYMEKKFTALYDLK